MAEDFVREEMDEEVDIITLEFDDDTAVDCEIMGTFEAEVNGVTGEYIALAPLDGTNDVYIYRYADKGDDGFEIDEILDDAEFTAVAEVFDALMEDAE